MADVVYSVMDFLPSNVEVSTLTVKFPKMIYDPDNINERRRIEEVLSFWKNKGFSHLWLESEEFNDSLFEQYPLTPCVACEIVKSKALFSFMNSCEDTAFLISHTLDDVFGYLIESLFLIIPYERWDILEKENYPLFERVAQLQKRVYKYFAYKPWRRKNVFVYKPILDFSESEIIKIIKNKKFPLIEESCPLKAGSQFVMFKRFIHRAIDWLRKRYADDKLMFENYESVIEFFRKKNLLIPKHIIENMEIRSGI